MPKQALESLTESMFYLLMALTQGELHTYTVDDVLFVEFAEDGNYQFLHSVLHRSAEFLSPDLRQISVLLQLLYSLPVLFHCYSVHLHPQQMLQSE